MQGSSLLIGGTQAGAKKATHEIWWALTDVWRAFLLLTRRHYFVVFCCCWCCGGSCCFVFFLECLSPDAPFVFDHLLPFFFQICFLTPGTIDFLWFPPLVCLLQPLLLLLTGGSLVFVGVKWLLLKETKPKKKRKLWVKKGQRHYFLCFFVSVSITLRLEAGIKPLKVRSAANQKPGNRLRVESVTWQRQKNAPDAFIPRQGGATSWLKSMSLPFIVFSFLRLRNRNKPPQKTRTRK